MCELLGSEKNSEEAEHEHHCLIIDVNVPFPTYSARSMYEILPVKVTWGPFPAQNPWDYFQKRKRKP